MSLAAGTYALDPAHTVLLQSWGSRKTGVK